ncbi:MAG: VWA domain-containing protein [Chloroflexota bacterium]
MLLLVLATALLGLSATACQTEGPPTPTAEPQPLAPSENSLTVAYSPEKEDLFLDLVAKFNVNRPEGMAPVHPVRVEMADMLERSARGEYDAISPDSSVWLPQVDRIWEERNPDASGALVGPRTRYALSPVVIAMWESQAQEMGYPEDQLGWEDLMERATEDPSFSWSHQAATTASGLLATTAEFYDGAGKQDNLTADDLRDSETIEYVRNIESTVQRYGGESEDRVVIRMLAEGGHPLDAFVAQEQMVVFFNQNTTGEKLVAIYPEEGTFWMDHPLVLLDGPWVNGEQQDVFREFADFVAAPEQQQMALRHGYRPGEVSASLQGENSLITPEFNVDPDEPDTLLQVPSAGVLEDIREVWQLTKKPANIYLVADVSGSMQGDKLAGAKGALSSFVGQVQGERDSLGLIAFSSEVDVAYELSSLDEDRREDMRAEIRGFDAGGGTMLYDAVAEAIDLLQENDEQGEINVVVAMTDGQSQGDIAVLESSVRQSDLPVLLFTVGYGEDADIQVLERIARMGDGRAYPSDPETIDQLYRLLSEFF